VLQTVKTIHCIDIEPLVLSEAKKQMPPQFAERCDFTLHDIICDPIPGLYDAAYSLDVIEHIQPDIETQFFKNICASLKKDAICIIGTPNLCASKHASAASKEGHINLKSEETLRSLMLKYFENVLVFSMNDEIIHTGYFPMAHYIMAVGASVNPNVA
jgi:2-polyprenyl-3-methyl-5-hydroxy-6-metoxy-1,4-benzoquinol methylase